MLDIERIKGADTTFDDIAEHVAGIYPRVMVEGEMDAGAWSCGLVAGLTHDALSVGELISRIVAEAQEIIGQRLPHFFPTEAASVPFG